jgi:cytochrome P450 family 628
MLALDGFEPCLAFFIVGAGLHVTLFRNGEWDLAVPKVLGIFIALQCLLVVALKGLVGGYAYTTLSSFAIVTRLGSSLVFGILTSLTIYRLLFHRLNKFPGPIWARLSNFYVTMLSARNLHLYEEVERLHGQYGDYVRLGKFR